MTPSETTVEGSAPRLEAIDQFRGWAIILMVLANYAAGVESIPAWLKHAPDVGLTVIDLIAPLFIFAIGLTFGLSARRRVASQGRLSAWGHFARRALALIGAGCIISAGERLLGYTGGGAPWGVLQAIGAAILVNLPLIGEPAWARLLGGLALLGGYQALLDHFWLAVVLGSSHGGLPGVLGWSAMLMLSTVLADLYHEKRERRKKIFAQLAGRRAYAWGCLLALALGGGLSFIAPVSKNRISSSYVLISLGVSGLCFWTFHLLAGRFPGRGRLLSAWGRNPLLLYLLHYLLLGLVVLPGIPAWYTQAPLWLAGLQAAGVLLALNWAALFLERRGWRFSL